MFLVFKLTYYKYKSGAVMTPNRERALVGLLYWLLRPYCPSQPSLSGVEWAARVFHIACT